MCLLGRFRCRSGLDTLPTLTPLLIGTLFRGFLERRHGRDYHQIEGAAYTPQGRDITCHCARQLRVRHHPADHKIDEPTKHHEVVLSSAVVKGRFM